MALGWLDEDVESKELFVLPDKTDAAVAKLELELEFKNSTPVDVAEKLLLEELLATGVAS